MSGVSRETPVTVITRPEHACGSQSSRVLDQQKRRPHQYHQTLPRWLAAASAPRNLGNSLANHKLITAALEQDVRRTRFDHAEMNVEGGSRRESGKIAP